MEKRAYLQSILPPGEAASLDLPSSRVDEAVRTQYDLALGHVLARQRAKDPAYADVDVSKLDYKSFFPVAWQIMRDPNILLRRDPNKPDIEEIVHDHSRPRPREPIQPGESRIRDEHGLWFPVPRGVEPPQWEQMLPLGPLMNYKAFWNLFPWVTIGGLMYGFANNFHVGMRRFVMQRGITTTGRAQGMYSIYYLVRSFRSTFRTLPFYLKRGLKRTWATFMPIPLFFAPQTGAERGVSFGIGAYAAYLNMTVLGGKRTMLQRVPRAVASFFIIGTVLKSFHTYIDDLSLLFYTNMEPYLGRNNMWREYIQNYERIRYRMFPDQRDDVRPDFDKLMKGRTHMVPSEALRKFEYVRGLRMRAGLEVDAQDWLIQPLHPGIRNIEPDDLLLKTWSENQRRAHRYSLDVAAQTRRPNRFHESNTMELIPMPEPSQQQPRPLWRNELLQNPTERALGDAGTPVRTELWPSPLLPPSRKFFGVLRAPYQEFNDPTAMAWQQRRDNIARGVGALGGIPAGASEKDLDAMVPHLGKPWENK